MTTKKVNEKDKDCVVAYQFNNRVFLIIFSVSMVANVSTHIFENILIVVCLSIVSKYFIHLSQIGNLIFSCSDIVD